MDRVQTVGFWLGIFGFALGELLFRGLGLIEGVAAGHVAAITILMATWWITEAVPIPVTSLLPVALFPLLGIDDFKGVALGYGNPFILLMMGGFFVSLALERWHLHRRIALSVISAIGTEPSRLVLGFLVATAGLSLWISNTATALMMLPVATAVIARLEANSPGDPRLAPLATAVLLGVAWASSIGGLGTPIGTAPNVIFLSQYQKAFPDGATFSFLAWLVMALPLVVAMLGVAWWVLMGPVRRAARGLAPIEERHVIASERAALGPWTRGGRLVIGIFLCTVLLWIFRQPITLGSLTVPGWADALGLGKRVDDSTVALLGALTLFIVSVAERPPGAPENESGPRHALLDWPTAESIPWGVLLLFGGGLALAEGFQKSGLSDGIGHALAGLASLPPWALTATLCLVVTFLTEVTSNTATCTLLMPILASLCKVKGLDPLQVMLPGALTASLGFMLPVGTPPNAIVFASGKIPIKVMARQGLVLNLVGVVLVTLAVQLLV